MGRPANPTPEWNPDRQIWEVRVTLPKPAEWPKGKEGPREWRDLPGILEDQPDLAKLVAKVVSDKLRRGEGLSDEGEGLSVTMWIEEWLKDRELRGILSAKQDGGRLKNHVLDVLGPLPMGKVSRRDLERVVEALDKKVRDGDLAWKTSLNVWALVTSMFGDACASKNRDLRVREDNPAIGIRPPDRGDVRSKVYLYPSEFLQLMECELVPLADRAMYAVLVYTFLRAGELQALAWSDVDLEHRVISVTKATDRRDDTVKSTKTGEARRIPIEANLLPLLQRLHEQRTGASVMRMPPHNERALRLRAHLKLAHVDREALHTDNLRQKQLTLHDLRGTGITWAAARGDNPLRIKQRAGHSGFATTEGYIREAENLTEGFGDPFPPLPPKLTSGSIGSVSAFRLARTHKSPMILRREGDSNPWYPYGHT